MTDNSAEREAERILEEAYAEVRAEECPQGDDCPVHFRVDEVLFEEDRGYQYARLITYSGDYVVVTEDNHKYDDPGILLGIVLGAVKRADLPPRWETTIYHVGTGVIGDLADKGIETRRDALRYAKEHDDWEYIQGVHETTVEALRAGLVDVSKPLEF